MRLYMKCIIDFDGNVAESRPNRRVNLRLSILHFWCVFTKESFDVIVLCRSFYQYYQRSQSLRARCLLGSKRAICCHTFK